MTISVEMAILFVLLGLPTKLIEVADRPSHSAIGEAIKPNA